MLIYAYQIIVNIINPLNNTTCLKLINLLSFASTKTLIATKQDIDATGTALSDAMRMSNGVYISKLKFSFYNM